MRSLLWIAAFVAACSVGAPTTKGEMAGKTPSSIESSDSHYGVYLQGNKVGWMRTRLIAGEDIEIAVELHASVAGLGTIAQIELTESRVYSAGSGQLKSIRFEQRAATGSVVVTGARRGAELEISITAGGTTTKKLMQLQDNLRGALATVRLAESGRIGDVVREQRFDASIQQNLAVEHRIEKIEKRVFAGVTVRAVQIASVYPSLGITEISWLDEVGTVLESRIGGFFVARLEPASVAKRLDYSQDILVSAVVKSPKPMRAAINLNRLELTFEGLDDPAVPSSKRQRVSRKGKRTTLRLTRDRPPSGGWRRQADDPDVAATPFIQSDNIAIHKAAKTAIGDAKDLFTATSRLASFVFEHVVDEYVPAYSNAVDALTSGRGDCTEHSILFVALARSLGIPARVAVGIAYWSAGGGFGWHAWAEVRADDGWYSVDPTWNQPIADVTHVKLAAGGPAEQARIVMLLGRLRLVDVVM